MKKLGVVLAIFAFFNSCSLENDMMLPKDPAGFETFEVKGQKSCTINSQKRLVTVNMPEGADLKSLTINKVSYFEATRLEDAQYPVLRESQVVDLSDTLRIYLKSYRTFEWKIIAGYAESGENPDPEGSQLYNFSLDDWSYQNGKTWFPYADDAAEEDRIWTSANPGVALLSMNTTVPEESFVHTAGGKAAKISSIYKVKFAAGTLFTGEFIGLKGFSGAEIAWGVPFSERPVSLKGWFCYQPVAIDRTDAAHAGMAGQTDVGQIQVILADWDASNPYEGYPDGAIDGKGRFHVINSTGQFVDFENDPAIIGHANYQFSDSMTEYKPFELDIEYRNGRTPKVVVIVCASSRYGDYFTGGTGSVLYIDDLEFTY